VFNSRRKDKKRDGNGYGTPARLDIGRGSMILDSETMRAVARVENRTFEAAFAPTKAITERIDAAS
jgi:hypothetical protein